MKYRIDKKTGIPFSSGLRGAMFRDLVFDEPYKDPDTGVLGHFGSMKTGREDLSDLKSWGANFIRWRINPMYTRCNTPGRSLEWVRSRLPELKKTLDFCSQNNMKVVVALMAMPGWNYEDPNRPGVFTSEAKMFYDLSWYNEFLEVWRAIASYPGVTNHPALYAYDVINEPVFTNRNNQGVKNWEDVYHDAGRIIRLYDQDTPIAIEPNISENSFSSLVPFSNIGKTVYSFHFYSPHSFTHQGLYGSAEGIVYPGMINGYYYDKEILRDMMRPVFQWQERYPEHKIFVGEFSAIRFATGAARYIEDCISLFEEYGWDWCYHAFREWPGWSVEHSGAFNDTNNIIWLDNTDRKEVLLKYYKLNEGVRSAWIEKV
ncbi:MAG: glycoside hydrolase family 5 protein [Bacteroidales bacterium]|nr:glycoside hydrolase family 5 protein [Bacteroidales bacterium]